MFLRCVALILSLNLMSNVDGVINASLINQFALPHAGFSTLLRTWTLNSTSWALLISCFNPLPRTADSVVIVPNIQYQLTTPITPEVVTNSITWPNGVVAADQLVPYSYLVPSGFLVPGKSNGNLYFMSSSGPIALVPAESQEWFYHGAAFKDMDNDGHVDIVTGRARVPLIGKPLSQMIWLKNPGNTTIQGPWKSSVLVPEGGADIQFQFAVVDSLQVLFANSFFSQNLQMLWSDSNEYWNDTRHLHLRNIDYQPGHYFYVQLYSDLNGDQKPDLLVTINDENNGTLIAYELPKSGDIRTGKFVKHVIASGFKPLVHAKGRGAPGQAAVVQFYSSTIRKKPILILSGDDDGSVYLLEALKDDDPEDWQYSIRPIFQSKSTIGQLSVEDVDGDGHPELFIPVYNEGLVLIYRLIDS